MVTIDACGAWTFKPSWLDGWTLWRAPLQTISILEALTETCFFATLWIKALNPSLLLKTVLFSIFFEKIIWIRFAMFFQSFSWKSWEVVEIFGLVYPLWNSWHQKRVQSQKESWLSTINVHGRKFWWFRNPGKTTSDRNKYHQTPVFFLADSPHLNGWSPDFCTIDQQWLLLGGGFKYFLFSPILGEMIQFD